MFFRSQSGLHLVECHILRIQEEKSFTIPFWIIGTTITEDDIYLGSYETIEDAGKVLNDIQREIQTKRTTVYDMRFAYLVLKYGH